ncbi:Oidioi.mRNA.OKI2018_I69.chr1.g2336.t1.cds [Oikopleura dioica]|uniref:Oidioi.mRNA.OKI2018_I69.chr1.g2336.t1.cds n=1 Tax=Oikopleura dioica TaxID=34765 RepID=A0ABN7SZY9_OIKDI|nr:Oidioi.mRNA.OKI2018_I69.chr1.g2336.t1.cds [Oikopleura dioica]
MAAEQPQFINTYRSEVCSSAKEILHQTIPNKLEKLDELIETNAMLQVGYCDEARQFSVDSLEKYENALKEMEAEKQMEEEAADEDDEVPVKKTKIDASSEVSVGLSKSKASQMSEGAVDERLRIPVNKHIVDLYNILKPELIELGQHCQQLKDWITIHVPRHEDGNNFGVEVQEEALNELQAIKEETTQTIDEQSAYHIARANIMEKIVQESNIEDLKIFVLDEDEKQCRRLRNVAMTVRTNYTTILDVITKNYDRLTNPRGNSDASVIGATTAASLLTTAAALVVFFSYKCDSIEFLQTGIILYYITIFLSLVEAILLFCAFGRACCDSQGCGSRLNTFLTYVVQTLLLLLQVMVIIFICIYGTGPAFENIIKDTDGGQELLDKLEEAQNLANEGIQRHEFTASSKN